MEDIVIVTGFGPFGEHKVNASWEAVKLLQKFKIDGAKIVVEEIPVTYSYVEERIPLLWEKYKPKLVVHVGVSSHAEKLTLERQAFRNGYNRKDCEGNTHPTGKICSNNKSSDCLVTKLDVQYICDHLNKTDVKACVSNDAGRYLCEYTFFKSLQVDENRTLFVHVPPLGTPYSAEKIASGLLDVIKCALKQLDCSCASVNNEVNK